MKISLHTPITKEKASKLSAGDIVELTGTIYTARDAAHQRIVDLIKEDKQLPFNLIDACIYYVGPSPAKPNSVIGAAGPTTSYRMDTFVEILMQKGLTSMIGKGKRSKEVKESIAKYSGVYFGATGGAAALLSKCIIKSEIIAFEDLGAEAVRKLEVKNMPLIVINDIHKNDLYQR